MTKNWEYPPSREPLWVILIRKLMNASRFLRFATDSCHELVCNFVSHGKMSFMVSGSTFHSSCGLETFCWKIGGHLLWNSLTPIKPELLSLVTDNSRKPIWLPSRYEKYIFLIYYEPHSCNESLQVG